MSMTYASPILPIILITFFFLRMMDHSCLALCIFSCSSFLWPSSFLSSFSLSFLSISSRSATDCSFYFSYLCLKQFRILKSSCSCWTFWAFSFWILSFLSASLACFWVQAVIRVLMALFSLMISNLYRASSVLGLFLSEDFTLVLVATRGLLEPRCRSDLELMPASRLLSF